MFIWKKSHSFSKPGRNKSIKCAGFSSKNKEKYGVKMEAWATFGEGRDGLFENKTRVNIEKDIIIAFICGKIIVW